MKRFENTDREWLQFVVDCRNGNDVSRDFDAVIGNVADDDVFKCVNMYMVLFCELNDASSSTLFSVKTGAVA